MRKWIGIVLLASVLGCGGGPAEETDAGGLDAGSVDAGSVDAGTRDAGALDAGRRDDAGLADAGEPPVLTRHSLVVALDGVRPDAVAYASTPNLDALINGTWQPGYRGAYTPLALNLADADTVSGPNHSTIMTGATSSQHGVTSNGDVGGGDFDTYRHYLRLLEDHDAALNTACLFTWSTDGDITSGADYILDGDDAGNTNRAASILAGTYEDPSGDSATSWAAGTVPDAVFLFYDDGDAAGHSQGFDLGVSAYIDALQGLDAQIGQLLEAIAGRESFASESWQIIVTSDHGGYHTGHSGRSAPTRAIPFLVASRDVAQGMLPQITQNRDVVPTVLEHMQVPAPAYLTGSARGADVAPSPPSSIGAELVRYLRFDNDLSDSVRGLGATIPPGSDIDPTLHATGGRFGGYVQIDDAGGGAASSSYLSLGSAADLDIGDGQDFTVALWYRSHGDQSGDPVILGNKNWVSGGNAGWLMLADEGANNSFGTNYASAGGGDRIDLEDIDYQGTGWWFLVAIFSDGGLATMYVGDAGGHLRFMALDATGVGSLSSPLPLNIGQDGTGDYPHNLDGDVDELAIWRRALGHQEVLRLYANGDGVELGSLL